MLDAVKEEQGQELEVLEALDDEQVCGEESSSCAGEELPLVFEVPAGKKPRLDAFLSSVCDESRSRLKKLVEQGRCTVDGQVCVDADQKVRPGQRVELRLPASGNAVEPEEGPLEILYRDADLAVVNKPIGLTMHPCPSCPKGTLVHRLLWHFPELARQEGPRPGVVHRLDKDTSGLVIVALSERARLKLIEDFAARNVHKTYLAVTRGIPAAEGTCDLPIGRHPTIKTHMAIVPEEKGGRTALTTWETLYASPAAVFSLLSVRLFTGRTHQIRVHLAQAGFPLWGDTVYGPYDKTSPAGRQLLHAWKLEFTHPVTGEEMRFTCPPPADFPHAMLALERGTRRVILTGMPGCGKSAVLERLEKRGMPVWNADRAVAAQYQPHAAGWLLMHQRWGHAFFNEDGSVDRAKLTRMLAETPGMRKELERIIHPLVRGSMDDFFLDAVSRGLPAACAEVPLWFETGWKLEGEASVTVIACPDETRHERLHETRGWTEEKIAAVESWQWKQEDKIRAADLVIDNSGTLADLDAELDRFQKALEEHGDILEEKLSASWQELWLPAES